MSTSSSSVPKKLNAAAPEWKPTFGAAAVAAAPVPAPTTSTSSSGSLRLTATEFVPSSIPMTTAAIPTPATATTASTPGVVPHVPPHQAAPYGYYAQYPPYGYYYDHYGQLVYPVDPNMLMMQQQQQMYEGHKSRSNSLTHQSEFSNSAAPASVATGKVAAAAATTTKVEETVTKETNITASTDSAVASATQSVENMKLESPPSSETPSTITSAPAESLQNGDKETTVAEGKGELEGWQRGKALAVEVAEKPQVIEKVALPDAGPSSWKRGISTEKSPAQMLLRQDGVKRFSREMIISLHVIGVTPVPEELAVLYGPKLTSNERTECKPLPGTAGPRSPNKGRRDGGNKQQGGRHQEIIDEPHPDEKTIFQSKTDVFRYDPNRVVDISASDRVINNAMVILNKLSVETFERLSDQFLNIGMETEEIMSRVVDLIVSKAQMEEHFCFMYADLCKKISDKWVSEDVEEGAAATAAATPAEGAAVTVDLGKIFKTRLLIRCQEEFQQDRDAAIQAVLELSIPEDDKEEKLFVLKKRYTGHMRFVGEIYMKDLLKPKNVYLSIEDLLASRDEEKLSCLCKLLQTVGKKLESYDLRKKKGKFVEYFQKISELSNEKSLSKKVRFGFKDLIEMRANNWVARRVEEKAKKLSEIRGADGAPTQQQQQQGGGGPGYGHQGGGGRGGNVTPRTQSVTFSHDVRNMPPPGGDGGPPADDWNVVPGKVKKGGAPPGRMTAPGRGYPSKPAPGPSAGPLNSSNKFSALTVGSSSRSGAKSSKGRSQDDDEGVKKEPRVSIPQSSDSQSPFSPNAEGGDDEAMSPTREGSSGAAGEDGELDETMTASIIATMNEYFLNDLLDEAVDVMKEKVHPNASGEAVRILIRAVLEKKDLDRKKFNIFLPALYTSGGFLSKEQCVNGISSFLHDFDDIVVDVPLVADYVASIISALYLVNAIDDLSFALHLPDENNFSLSMNQFSLIVKTAAFIQRSSDEATAKKFFVSSLGGRSVSELDSMEKEQVERAIEKNQASFLV